MRKKISDPYKPRKKCSRHAHESIKPCLYGTGALEVGAEKKSELVFFISKRALGGPPYCITLRHMYVYRSSTTCRGDHQDSLKIGDSEGSIKRIK